MSRLNALRTAPSFRLHRATVLSLALLAASVATPAAAAKVYRCGNVFQDQPCPEVKAAVAPPVERTLVARETPCPPASRDRAASLCSGRTPREDLHRVAVDLKR